MLKNVSLNVNLLISMLEFISRLPFKNSIRNYFIQVEKSCIAAQLLTIMDTNCEGTDVSIHCVIKIIQNLEKTNSVDWRIVYVEVARFQLALSLLVHVLTPSREFTHCRARILAEYQACQVTYQHNISSINMMLCDQSQSLWRIPQTHGELSQLGLSNAVQPHQRPSAER